MPQAANARSFHAADATLTETSLTDIPLSGSSSAEIILGDGENDLWFEVANQGQALAGFALLGKTHVDGTYFIIKETTGWDTAGTLLDYVLGTIKTLASGSKGYARVNLGPLYAIKFQAYVASSTTALNIRGRLGRR